MSASRRRINTHENWLSSKIERVSGKPEYQEKLRSITALQTGHWERQDCSQELTVYACLAVSSHQGRPEALERHWASQTGKNWKALTEFPERLSRMADEVEHINQGDPAFFARTPHWNVDRNESSNLREVCKQLPHSMRSYANALRERNAYVARVTPKHGREKALFDLSEMVEFFTGAYLDRQVAELLSVAAEVLEEDVRFEAASVAQARFRHRKKTAKT
jgi:hypothetical protein